ncbi:hypothetical protein WH87_12130 [Devosia epidermidihirudinis]|uniref:HTH gntR-type domain-containing protein n=1 Tax=Devosia epidermidihirudinis TaxID=1293439 RepID=A0A0F5Q8J8_9HYPH|nr:hypothetical protein [Devosia epidermidihirudinis]KKC37297.1 hypothetical protein WH87_12130 [Devosia epidermidihirudinis]
MFRRWKTNGLKVGDKIESQNEITKFCDFSLITVIKTLKDLETEGVIRRQVGKGSFLVKAPWAEAHHRIGFFYNRDIVGGGIFNNEFYTRLVIALEKNIVSDGHEFIMGSFTHNSMPIVLWDRLDLVLLTGVTGETSVKSIGTTSSQVSVIDAVLDLPFVHSYRIDYRPAFDALFDRFGSTHNRVLYLDTVFDSTEREARLEAFQQACSNSRELQDLRVIRVNQEGTDDDTAALEQAMIEFQPDLVCGYMRHSWHKLIPEYLTKPVRVYPYVLDSSRPGFVVDSGTWMSTILPMIYEKLEDRRAESEIHSFPARFVP